MHTSSQNGHQTISPTAHHALSPFSYATTPTTISNSNNNKYHPLKNTYIPPAQSVLTNSGLASLAGSNNLFHAHLMSPASYSPVQSPSELYEMISPDLATGHNGSENIVKLENLQNHHSHHNGGNESRSPHSDTDNHHEQDINSGELHQLERHIVSSNNNINKHQRPSVVKLE